ncbi:hypothetical protein Agub_g552 [Astrephomene gubernaculifera]|uniref:Uncharacterized protein n=1 Tax=Astrephomene gubernaculifera TaxID=47775 RepID=A0AAD3DGL8_9CHLO|nr:hypothetical protein Agub_g552 [Astrephomene gubernaculifera]
MVSTRSGRVVSADTSYGGRVTRSRSRKESEILAETLTEEALAAEAGQPEVTSPFPTVTPSKEFSFRPVQPPAFGSPAPVFTLETPMAEQVSGTPFQERVIKTVGKAAAQTPVARSPAAPTPSAKDVMQMAEMPLPEDSAADEPFASSEDEPLVPASPAADLPAAPYEQATQRRAARGGGRLFWSLFFTSILATLAVGLFLAPCGDPELFAMVPSKTYGPLCQNLVTKRGQASDVASSVFARAMEKATAVSDRLPAPTLELLGKVWEPVQQAHAAALPFLDTTSAQIGQRLTPILVPVKTIWQRCTRGLYSLLGPFLHGVMAHKDEGSSVPSGVAMAPISCMEQSEFLAILDQSPQQQQYAQDLWEFAGVQVAEKQKAAAWVLTCRNEAECGAAKGALFGASSGFLHIEGPAFSEASSAGQLQLELVDFLRSNPRGLVLVTKPERLHPNSVVVLNNALSESGHLQMDGQPVATAEALYVVLVEHVVQGADAEEEVKDRLVKAISEVDPNADPNMVAAVVRSFRRRLDAVLFVKAL